MPKETFEAHDSNRILGLLLPALLLTVVATASVLVAPLIAQEDPEVEAVQEVEPPAEEPGVVATGETEPTEQPETVQTETEQPEAEQAEPAIPAAPEEPDRPRARVHRYDTSVQIFSGLTVEENEIYEEAVAIMGPLNIYGTVSGDAVAVGGPVEVTGTVGGELVSIGGPVYLGPTARVGRLVNVGGSLTKDEGAVVEDAIEDHGTSGFSINISDGGVRIDEDARDEADRDRDRDAERRRSRRHAVGVYQDIGDFVAGVISNFVLLMLLVFVLAVAAVLAPKLIDRTVVKLTTDPWKAAVAGVLAEIGFLPALVAGCIFLVISIVGIFLLPAFVPLMFLALAVAFVLGFASVSQYVGALVADRFEWSLPGRVPRIALGAVALHLIWLLGWLLGLLPGVLEALGWGTWIIGGLIVFIAWTTGLGALLLAAFDPPRAESVAEQAPPPPSPVPTEGETAEATAETED